MTPVLRRLVPDDVFDFKPLRLEALTTAPTAFASSPKEMPSTAEHKRRIGCAPSAGGTFGAFVDGALVGMVGLHRLPRRKTRHRVALWGLYVTPGQRRQGLGRRLLDLALAHVEEAMPGVGLVELEVAADATHVRRLYEAVGFEPLGEHPGALLVDGEAVATVLYVRPVAAD